MKNIIFKHHLIRIIYAVVLTFYIVGNASAQEIDFTVLEQKWIEEHPVIEVSGGSEAPPIQFIRNDQAYGYSIDYMKLVAEKAGLKFNFVNEERWTDSYEKIKNREIDIIHSISQTEERDEFLNFTQPYIDYHFSYFGPKGSAPINSIKDLQGKRIGVIDGWATTKIYQKDFPHLNLIYQTSQLDGLYELKNGSIDVFILQEPAGNYLIEQNFITGLEVVGKKFIPISGTEEELRLAVHKDLPLLHDILRKATSAITENEKNNLLNKWKIDKDEDIGLTDEEKNWLFLHKTIRVATDPDAPPIAFIDQNGDISGISGEYLKIISKKLNVDFQWIKNKTLSQGIISLKKGEADILSAVATTPERAEFLNFSDSYLEMVNVIFARSDNTAFGSLESLSGHTLSQVENFANTEYLKQNYPNIKLIKVKTVVEALHLLNDGKVDAYMGNIPTVASAIASENFVQIVVVGETLFRPKVSVATRKDLPLLASSIQKAMRSITDIEHTEISQKWLALKIEQVESYNLLWKVITVAFIILTFFFIWNSSLRSEITRRKKAEINLRLSQQEAERANSAKSAFLANMSHEIRTPLNAIIGFSEIMSSGIFGKIENDRYIEYLNDINTSGTHLATVIDDILDLSKIEAGKWKLKETDFSLNKCIKSAVDMFKLLAKRKNIDLSSHFATNCTDLTIRGDQHCIKRAIINLLSNATKFTNNGGTITCKISLNDKGDVLMEINDTGIGIPSERLDHVLNPFGQIQDNEYLNEEGTGLGLSIVKNLIELHDGNFTLKSEINVGTQAIISIPAIRVYG